MATGQQASGAGFRRVQLIELKQDNFMPIPPDSAGGVAQAFKRFSCAKAFTPTYPDPDIITHTGDDGICGVVVLPPREIIAGEIRTGKTNLEADAIFQNISPVQIGDMESMARGIVPQTYQSVGLLMHRQAINTVPGSADRGADRFIWAMVPMTKVVPKAGTMEEGGADENTYSMIPQIVNRYLYGFPFDSAIEGYAAAQIVYGISNGPPVMNSFLIDAVPLLTLTLDQSARLSLGGTDYAISVFLWASATGIVTDITGTSTLTDPDDITVVGAIENDIVYAFYEAADVTW